MRPVIAPLPLVARNDSDFLPCPDFDLGLTLKSGQVFRWREASVPDGCTAHFTGWIEGSPARVSQENSHLRVEGVSVEAARRFFSLDTDLPALARQMDVDEVIHSALQRHWGLRVIRQEPWECTASFILSAYNNIPRLTGMLDTLASRFGRPLAPSREWVRSRSVRAVRRNSWMKNTARTSKLTYPSPGRGLSPAPGDGEVGTVYSFPRPEVLARVSERVLRNCGLGYRAPYLKAVAQKVAVGEVDLEKLRGLEDEELRRALLTLPGIGEKVVECVMLFAYGRGAAFPVDVWIGRAMRQWYFRRRKVANRRIRQFARKHFGPHCGWAQQVLYCYAREEIA